MKKLFTTLLMMGIALCGWATITETSNGNTVTLNYVDDGNSNDQNFSLSNKNATTIVLTGDWANKDLQRIGSIVGQCSGNVFLDLSACSNMVSKVNTGTANFDWTSDNLTFLPDPNNPETVQRTGTATKVTKYYESWGAEYTGSATLEQHSDGLWYEPGTNWNGKTAKDVYLDENGKELPAGSVNTSTLTYSYTETLDTTKFSLAGNDFSNNASKLSGIAFPNHANFTAIPDDVFGETGPTNMTSVTFGNNLLYIGKHAFKSTKLTSIVLPASLKAIGGEAFDYITTITELNLEGCTNLVKIGFEAFEFCSNLETVVFPEGDTFTFLGNDAFKETGIVTLDMSMCEGIREFQSNAGKYKQFVNCLALTTVILPPNLTEVPDDTGDGVFFGSNAIQTVTFTGHASYNDCELLNPCTIGDKAFYARPNLTSITLSNNISSIGELAFGEAAITEIHIPASMEELEKHCFYHCTKLVNIYFDEFDKTLGDCVGAATHIAGASGSGGQGQGAFEECQNVTDVYINTLAELQCGNNAYDQDISWGAGDAGANFATLHFPKEKTEHYVNLSHYLTDEIVQDAGLFHDWLMEHYNQAIIPHKNGWYEFINSGPTDPDAPVYQDIILRTFSDWEYSYLVPDGIRAYVVDGFEALTEDTYQVSLKRIRVIPAQTGVILYGHPNGKNQDGSYALVMTPVHFIQHGDPIYEIQGEQQVQVGTYQGESQGLPLRRDNWDHSSNYVKNYLMPIITEDGSPVHIKPYEKYQDDPTKPVMFRNFALGRYSVTDYAQSAPLTSNENNYVGFFRMKDRDYASGYAYLRFAGDVDENGQALAADKKEFDVASGGEILVKEDAGNPQNVKDPNNPAYYCEFNVVDGKVYNMRTEPSMNPKGWWDESKGFTWKEYKKSWGDRTIQFGSASAAKYFGELEENADGIVKIVVPASSIQGDYYTLQGVKVTNPTKGVYIQNGKKVIVK